MQATRPYALLEHDQQHHSDHHHKQEWRRLQETVGGVVEVDLDVPGRQRTGRQGRQEGPDPNRRGDADALEYVEGEMHRAVPWSSVTIDERAPAGARDRP